MIAYIKIENPVIKKNKEDWVLIAKKITINQISKENITLGIVSCIQFNSDEIGSPFLEKVNDILNKTVDGYVEDNTLTLKVKSGVFLYGIGTIYAIPSVELINLTK